MNKIRLAILASGSGSNAEAIMKWAKNSQVAVVVCVGSDKKKALVHERAKNLQVPSFSLTQKRGEDRSSFDLRLFESLQFYRPDWIILAGYMKLLSPDFLARFPGKVINIHPSLLPDFPGMDAYSEAFHSGVEISGCTVHFVDEGMDTGRVIAQKKFPRYTYDTLEDFKSRGLSIENTFYPEVIEKLLRTTL